MKRLTEAWFEFDGVRCDDMHLRLMAMPKRPIPARQGERFEISGRDGFLWSSRRGARHPITIQVECCTEDGFSADELAAWLMQDEGLLRFSDEPSVVYRACVVKEFLRESVFLRFNKQRFIIPFDCQPRRYLYPAQEPIVLTETGTITNPGALESLPRITVEGSGDMVVYIGEQQIGISDGSVIVDSEMMDCFELDGVSLANMRVTMDEFPTIPAGETAISWTGAVEKVTIEGRW